MPDHKIAFKELDLITLIAIFENNRLKGIDDVIELLLCCLSPRRDTRLRMCMKLKAVGHVYTRFHLNLTALYSADLIATF